MTQIFGDFALRIPFLVAAALTAVNWLYGFFILPESLPPERRMARFDWKRANPVGSLGFLKAHGDLMGCLADLKAIIAESAADATMAQAAGRQEAAE